MQDNKTEPNLSRKGISCTSAKRN